MRRALNKERVDLTPMMPAEEGMSFRTGFIRITALPCCSASSTCSNQGSGHSVTVVGEKQASQGGGGVVVRGQGSEGGLVVWTMGG